MDENRVKSRRRAQRRNSGNKILYLVIGILIIVFIVLLLVLVNKGKNSDDINNDHQETNESNDQNDSNSSLEDNLSNEDNELVENNDLPNNEEDDNLANDDSEGLDNDSLPTINDIGRSDSIEVIESNEDHVIESYVANWPPVGTSQTGEHNSDFNEGSPDRLEINQAITQVTSLTEDEYTLWWVGNDGFNKAYTHIENKATNELYQLFLSWIDNEGWQVTKVDKLSRSEHKEQWTDESSSESNQTENEE